MSETEATAERIGKAAAIDPIVAVAIITALVQLVTLCVTEPTPEKVAATAKNPTLLEWAVMRHAVYREMRANRVPRGKRAGVWQGVQVELQSITPEAARSICLDCQATADYS
jgi:hypothetical protein